jgi:transposase
LGLVEQTFSTGSRRIGKDALKGADRRSKATAEQMEISRLRAELAWVTMERDILGNAMAYFAKGQK